MATNLRLVSHVKVAKVVYKKPSRNDPALLPNTNSLSSQLNQKKLPKSALWVRV